MEEQNCKTCKYVDEPFEFPLCITCKQKRDRNSFLLRTNWEPKEEEKLCKNCGVSSLEDQLTVCTHCFDHSKWRPKEDPMSKVESMYSPSIGCFPNAVREVVGLNELNKEEKEMSSMLSEYAAAVNKCNDAPNQVSELPSIARVAQTALNALYNASDTLRSMECAVMGDKSLQSACTAVSLQPENLTDNIKYILEAANNINSRLNELYAKIAG